MTETEQITEYLITRGFYHEVDKNIFSTDRFVIYLENGRFDVGFQDQTRTTMTTRISTMNEMVRYLEAQQG